MKVLNVGRISLEKYEKVSANILTRDVIITEERIRHIQERHPNDYERFKDYLTEIVEEPDYIIRANKPNTALILKEITFNNEQFKLILRLITESDDPKYKNSIITFMKIDEKEWNRLVRNKETLYKKD